MANTVTNMSIQSTSLATHSSLTSNSRTGQNTKQEIELDSYNATNETNYQPEIEQTNLPQADGGRDAYLFLCGCFMAEAMCWGELSGVVGLISPLENCRLALFQN